MESSSKSRRLKSLPLVTLKHSKAEHVRKKSGTEVALARGHHSKVGTERVHYYYCKCITL